ncbi:hypothetical protein PAMP_001593 [Pampus punctatissimus]
MARNESLVALNGTQISYIGHDCGNIPEFLGDTYGQLARRLDLSFNELSVCASVSVSGWAGNGRMKLWRRPVTPTPLPPVCRSVSLSHQCVEMCGSH